MAKTPHASNQTFAMDGLTVRHINNRMGASPVEKALTTAHLAQALGGGSATSQSQGAAPQAAPAPAAGSTSTPQKE